MKRIALFLVIGVLLAACQGTLKVHPATDEELKNGYEGLLFYPVTRFEEITRTTVHVNRDGKVIATEAGIDEAHCEPIETSRIVVSSDFSRPMILNYDHGILEVYKLSVEFHEGVLKSVNTESSPDRGQTFANLASAAKSAAEIAAATRIKEPSLACNEGVAIVGYKPYNR